ncbi:hypothetical protein M0802_013836 [Mischocyttarus mexicanus]|nr:hypothetical protein M0802_013845 [Mischocyttarus mexicanus]KAI4481925.1 hypothetical protein M0802_013836 [Mischocyttarus mexicanus]
MGQVGERGKVRLGTRWRLLFGAAVTAADVDAVAAVAAVAAAAAWLPFESAYEEDNDEEDNDERGGNST